LSQAGTGYICLSQVRRRRARRLWTCFRVFSEERAHERAEHAQLQSLLPCRFQGGLRQRTADSSTTRRLVEFGVDEDEDVRPSRVRETGDVSVDDRLEAARARLVAHDDRRWPQAVVEPLVPGQVVTSRFPFSSTSACHLRQARLA